MTEYTPLGDIDFVSTVFPVLANEKISRPLEGERVPCKSTRLEADELIGLRLRVGWSDLLSDFVPTFVKGNVLR